MNPQQPDEANYESAALDELIDSAMNGILAKLEAGFDPNAGLANIYARCGVTTRPAPAPEVAEPSFSARLQEVCDQIDLLDAWFAAVIDSARTAPFGGSAFVEMARPSLRQLRMGLANRTLARSDAEHLIGEVQGHLDQADHILRSQHASSLDEVMRERSSAVAGSGGTVGGQIRVLQEMITRLFADIGQDPALVPAL
jgi:hypothetical protein